MMNSNAVFSEDYAYRYVLWRIWDESKPKINFIGLNPSTADEIKDDATMRRCKRFAIEWGYGGFYMTNLFAFKATYPEDLKRAKDPVGRDNLKWILDIKNLCDVSVFVWGVNGNYLNQDKVVLDLISDGFCIDISKDGYPKHPLYLKANLRLKKYEY